VKILLDTCDFLWFISGDSALSRKTIDAVQNPENEVFLSVASFWEILIKYGRGKLTLSDSPCRFIPEQRELHGIQSLPILESALKRLPELPEIHRDPFDRIIVCQALDAGMALGPVIQL
jgi:PIN domain nuclease of toxin-antitoxin system